MKKWIIGIGLLLLCLSLAAGRWVFNLQTPSEDAIAQVKPGMTMLQVEGILGAPDSVPKREEGENKFWLYEDFFKVYSLTIEFSPGGKVVEVRQRD